MRILALQLIQCNKGHYGNLFATIHNKHRIMYWWCPSVCQHFNICLNIKQTVSGIYFKPYTQAHIDNTFQMRSCLVTLTLDHGCPTVSYFLFCQITTIKLSLMIKIKPYMKHLLKSFLKQLFCCYIVISLKAALRLITVFKKKFHHCNVLYHLYCI